MATATTDRFYRQLAALGDNDPDGILHGIVAGLLDQADDVVQVISDTDAGPGWSALLDVDRCPTWALRWLGQLVGVRVPATIDDTESRALIAEEAGFGRGRPAALIAAAKRFLRPGFDPIVVERYPDAYHVTVTVYASWLLGATYRELSEAYATYTDLEAEFPTYDAMTSSPTDLAAAVTAAKSASLLLTLVVLETASYSYLTAHYATYTDLATAFPTYDAMTEFTP